jgi:hypothetical protein
MRVQHVDLSVQGEALSPDEAIKMISACADSKGRVWYENTAGMLQ